MPFTKTKQKIRVLKGRMPFRKIKLKGKMK
jgi:hypothetical protein